MIAPPSSPRLQQQQQQQQQAQSDGAESDSDWDDDDDFVAKKINIKIKPIAQLTPGTISASTDELRATVGTWKSMANINLVKPNSRRSMHQSTTLLNKIPFDSTGTGQAIQQLPLQQPLAALQGPTSRPMAGGDGAPNTDNQHLTASDTNPQLPAFMMPLPPRVLQPQQQQQQQHPPPPPLPSSRPPFAAPQQFDAPTLAPLILPLARPAKQPCLPVAFATQECLNVHTLLSSEGEISTSLIGHIKMAVPRLIIDMNPSYFENNDLALRLVTSKRWSGMKVDETFVRAVRDEPSLSESYFFKVMSIDMNAAYLFARERFQKQPDSRYFLLPELVGYTIRSHDSAQAIDGGCNENSNAESRLQFGGAGGMPSQDISPVQAVAHWLCDLTVTKVRVDLEFREDSLELAHRVLPIDVRNVKLSLQVNGNVVSQQSKPEAAWSPIDSRLTWSFASLQELIESGATVNGITSCLAKLTLADGPSTPSATSLQFSISGKTICGAHLSLVEGSNGLAYKLVRQKQEVRTGTFRLEPPCL